MAKCFFNQLTFYPINVLTIPELNLFNTYLNEAAFSSCTEMDWNSSGFICPVSDSPVMVYPAQNTLRIALKTEEKVIPSSVIGDILKEKISEIRKLEGRKVGRKEKMELKETIKDDLLPRAFTKSSITEALIDTQRGLLLINQANTNRAEMLLTKLRNALGRLEARLPRTQQSLSSLMTEWLLAGKAAGNFELSCDGELIGIGDARPVVRIRHHDLTAEEVVNLVRNGKVVTQLGLCWQDCVSFVLTENFTLKRIQFHDMIQEEIFSLGKDELSIATATQLIMVNLLSEMIEELVSLLGGWLNS